MTDIDFKCPSCGGELTAAEALRGRTVTCPHCQASILVPKKQLILQTGHPQHERKRFKVHVIQESAMGTVFFGASGLPARRLEEYLNEQGAQGWDVSFMVVEKRRMALFWIRDAVLVTMSKGC